MRTAASTAIALCLVLSLAGSASADLTVPGQKIIEVTCTLEFGPYKDYSARRYEVVEGDTLEKISTQKLGKPTRWREITAMNEGLDHKALKVGQVLWIPAAKSKPPAERTEQEAVEAPTSWWHFYAAPGGGHFGQFIERIADGDKVPHHHYYTSVCAVRADQHAAFQKALDEPDDSRGLSALFDKWKSKSGFAMGTKDLPGRGSVSSGSGTRRRVETWRVTKIDGNELSLKNVGQKNLDANGETVRRMGGLFGMNGLLLALAFVALSGIIALARRRRVAPSNA